MSPWVTYDTAAAILGCHVSNVPKLIRKGELTSTGKRGVCLNRKQVEALAHLRAAEREERASRTPRMYQRIDHCPDHDHDWLSPGRSPNSSGSPSRRPSAASTASGLPAVENGGRFWVRRDHLEQVEAARLVRKTRRP